MEVKLWQCSRFPFSVFPFLPKLHFQFPFTPFPSSFFPFLFLSLPLPLPSTFCLCFKISLFAFIPLKQRYALAPQIEHFIQSQTSHRFLIQDISCSVSHLQDRHRCPVHTFQFRTHCIFSRWHWLCTNTGLL